MRSGFCNTTSCGLARESVWRGTVVLETVLERPRDISVALLSLELSCSCLPLDFLAHEIQFFFTALIVLFFYYFLICLSI